MTTQAEIFKNYMRAVWDNVVEDADGDVYDRHHDANEIAQVLMAKPTGQDDSEWREWLFHDGRAALDECLEENMAFFRSVADMNGGQNGVQ